MNSNRGLRIGSALLVSAALLIWLRDLSWIDSPAETVPLTLGLVLMWWVGSPWKLRSTQKLPIPILLLAGALFLSGWMMESITLMAFGWTGMAWAWIRGTFQPSSQQWPALLTGLFSFPWLLFEWTGIGFWFRYTAAASTGWFFEFLALPVERLGTSLTVIGLPIEVTEACAGWNLLQLSILFGLAVAGWQLRGARFLIVLALLAPLAWLANTFRIALLSALALSTDVDVASGSLHTLTGLLVLLLTFMFTRILCELAGPNVPRRRKVGA